VDGLFSGGISSAYGGTVAGRSPAEIRSQLSKIPGIAQNLDHGSTDKIHQDDRRESKEHPWRGRAFSVKVISDGQEREDIHGVVIRQRIGKKH